MQSADAIKTAFERSAKAISLKPSLGKGTGISHCRITHDLTCEISEGPWKFIADMSPSAGGKSEGPSPGVYGRGALGSCLAMGYMMYAAKLGVPIQSMEIEVQADYDDGVLFDVHTDRPAGYLEVRYTVSLVSDAPEADIMRVLDEGDAHSPYLDVFSRAQNCVRKVNIKPVN